jgi:acetoacetate decarboxylase
MGACSKYAHRARGRGISSAALRRNLNLGSARLFLVYNLEDIVVHGAWDGPARLHYVPHVNCRVADLPVKRIVGGRHQLVDFVLPYGRVLHDYLA